MKAKKLFISFNQNDVFIDFIVLHYIFEIN